MGDVFFLLVRKGLFDYFTVFYCLIHVLKEKFMVTLFDSEDIVAVVFLKIVNVRSIGSDPIFVDNYL